MSFSSLRLFCTLLVRWQYSLQNDQIPDEHRKSVVDHVVHVHLSVGKYSKEFQQKLRRVNHVTPKNYLDFISSYTRLLQDKDKFVQDQCHRLEGGLTKLMEAAEQIKVRTLGCTSLQI